MQLLVFSDSHGKWERMKEMVARCRAEVVLFLGDGLRDWEMLVDTLPQAVMPLAVRGNCDGLSDGMPAERVFALEGIRILMLHGHTRSVKNGTKVLEAYATSQNIDLVLYGHTHMSDDRYLLSQGAAKPIHIFSPGSIGGALSTATFGTVEIRGGQLLTNIVSYKEMI